MALDVEGIEPLHLALPPPRRLMRILSSVVLPSPALMVAFDPRAAALYDRKSSVTNRSGTKAYFFRSLRISFNAACFQPSAQLRRSRPRSATSAIRRLRSYAFADMAVMSGRRPFVKDRFEAVVNVSGAVMSSAFRCG